ncbi:SDR family NAD(P)-dependent oxidoreductase [Nocardioides sp.]|uniref:SDR family NAD(P)-dependent oxidoreductase n=1 Tax=Nocardioides sp. TaxID=35761 RepID=UPI0035143F5B
MSRRTRRARAVVTGAGSGIGRALALELARRGSQVVCADLALDTAAVTAGRIEAAGGRALAVRCDVASATEVVELEARSRAWFGEAASLVCNNAGIGAGGHTAEDTPLADWERTLGVNLWGVIHGCRTFVPAMRAAGGGGVVNVASAAGFTAAPRMAAYNVSKAGVVSLSETLAAELSGTGVGVTVLCPTFVRTGIFEGELIDARARQLAASLAKVTGFSPERVARTTLDALDKGRLYVVPQPDAQLLWRTKRLVPVPYTRVAGLLGRVAPPPSAPPGATTPTDSQEAHR